MDYYDHHPTLELERALALVGFMGAGVAAVAHGLAARTGLPLFDLPRLVESRAGRSWSQLLLEDGPDALGEAECEALRQSLRDGAHGVVALSHGALLHAGIREQLEGQAHLVYVERPLDVLFRRVVAQLREHPASIAEFMLGPPAAIDDLRPYFDECEPGYREAQSILMARDLHAQEVVDALLQELRGGGGA
jgi:shikimate kinase